ncbi:hypothetical protein QMK19_32090 [Streptomyces sp. H10-C2]|uniref:hypothetical protein n=1 Tax=unclassified Streptomyces TaxID=2593676 RepID=UPI0024BB4E02|nr:MULTISPECIES: hypothetical protein [unclassified Streptomyces]MDJ0345182.1 hypothetical protein [Streptomyces sp. PH10-H1]MDJ0374150.1 hypothetical protein [Streptomyces sp. H10-C2]
MRNDFTPQVETREISDNDLDNVSGGVGVGFSGGVGVNGLEGLVGTATSALPIGAVTGLVPAVTGIAGL